MTDIVRGELQEDSFLVLARDVAKETTISLRAKGLLVELIELPKGTRISARSLAQTHKEGRDAILTVLDELRNAGYLELVKPRNGSGQFRSSYYLVRTWRPRRFSRSPENPDHGSGKTLRRASSQVDTEVLETRTPADPDLNTSTSGKSFRGEDDVPTQKKIRKTLKKTISTRVSVQKAPSQEELKRRLLKLMEDSPRGMTIHQIQNSIGLDRVIFYDILNEQCDLKNGSFVLKAEQPTKKKLLKRAPTVSAPKKLIRRSS